MPFGVQALQCLTVATTCRVAVGGCVWPVIAVQLTTEAYGLEVYSTSKSRTIFASLAWRTKYAQQKK